MKILHTSDWHLGKKLGAFSRLAEQGEVLNEIEQICDKVKPDVIIVAGDLFDNFNPPTEAVELLYRSLKRLTRGGQAAVIALAGNHDSPERIEAPDPLARECGIFFLGYPDSLPSDTELDTGLKVSFPEVGILNVMTPGSSFPLRLLATPYANEVRLRRSLEGDKETALETLLKERWGSLAEKYCDTRGVNILAGHFFAAPRGDLFSQDPEEEEGERPILHPGGLELLHTDIIPKQIQYTALGHLHRPQVLSGGPSPVIYSGTPLAYSLSEREQPKEVVLIEAEPGKAVKVVPLPLKSGRTIHRKQFSDAAAALTWLEGNPDVYVELLLETEAFITSDVKNSLFDAHDGILTLIPVFPGKVKKSENSVVVERGRSVPDLFTEYFQQVYGGVAPGDELMAVLSEVLGKDEEVLDEAN